MQRHAKPRKVMILSLALAVCEQLGFSGGKGLGSVFGLLKGISEGFYRVFYGFYRV